MENAPFDFLCPCGACLKAPARFEGRRMRCPACLAIVKAERVHIPEAPIVDPAPAPRVDPDRAVPFVASADAGEPSFRASAFSRIWGDFMKPVCLTWFALLGIVLWTGDDMGSTPAQVMFLAYTAGFLFAGVRLPRHLDMSVTDSLL